MFSHQYSAEGHRVVLTIGIDLKGAAESASFRRAPASPGNRSSSSCVSAAVGDRPMVMQSSTGQTSEQRLQPTQSSSRTFGNRFAGNATRAEAVAVRRHQVDALVRAVFAGDVAQVAADALVVIDARDALVIQVERSPTSAASARPCRRVRITLLMPLASR